MPVWFGRIGFWKGFLVRDGRRWLSNTEEDLLGVGAGQGRKFWQMRSQLMAGRSGLASFVLTQMCGRGGVADVVGTISSQVCKENTTRRCV